MIKMQCPAKVNLFLEVTGRRSGGYHTLATLFAKIALFDVLEFEPVVTEGPKPVRMVLPAPRTAPLPPEPSGSITAYGAAV